MLSQIFARHRTLKDHEGVRAIGGNGMTEARIEISSTDFEFFRVVLTDRAGKQAWSNPYWMDDLGLH